MNQDKPSRRTFMKSAGAAAGAASVIGAPNILHAQNKGDKLRVAFIGVGGIGGQHTGLAHKAGDICNCYCEVDTARAGNVTGKAGWEKAKGYQDYREMLDKEQNNFDAVMVGTPDHHHYPAAILSMMAGKHVYVQKPLTHTVWEARELLKAKRKYNLATQMGNQGHANNGNRKMVEWIQQGKLGKIKEVHCFTNRPVWPQGQETPQAPDPVPDSLAWDLWLGPAAKRPYHKSYMPFVWRGWWDFGGGALADMACHTVDCMWWAMDPGAPTSVELQARSPMTDQNFPRSSVIKYEFPAKDGRDAFQLYWYDGDMFPAAPEHLEYGRRLPSTGAIFVGEKCSIMSAGDYGDRPRIIPEVKMKEIGKAEETIERAPEQFRRDTTQWHYDQWRQASMGNKAVDYPGSNFEYAAPFSEDVLLGNVALKTNKKLDWDSENLKVTNVPEANQYIHKEYREGWDFKMG